MHLAQDGPTGVDVGAGQARRRFRRRMIDPIVSRTAPMPATTVGQASSVAGSSHRGGCPPGGGMAAPLRRRGPARARVTARETRLYPRRVSRAFLLSLRMQRGTDVRRPHWNSPRNGGRATRSSRCTRPTTARVPTQPGARSCDSGHERWAKGTPRTWRPAESSLRSTSRRSGRPLPRRRRRLRGRQAARN